jgi:hypothetical protein
MPVTFAAVRKFALSLDNVEEAPSYGTPGFRVGGVLFLRFHQDAESLVVRTDFDHSRNRSAALSGVMSRCGDPSSSNPTMNLRT